jgi:predicted GNAT family acetyltransferase
MKLTDNDVDGRYEIKLGDDVAFAHYQMRGNSIVFTHTEVPDELRGQGIGTDLIRGALDDARKRELTVVPLCPFVREFIEGNPEYQDLVETGEEVS